jgi:head-tail adaptor
MDASEGTSTEALEVLRDIWAATGRTQADSEHLQPTGRICKNTAMLGIKGMDDEGMASAMRSEWRRQLADEGKLTPGSRSIGAEFAAQIADPQD